MEEIEDAELGHDLRLEVTRSLDAGDGRLYSVLPYLLQDLWELGAEPEVIRELLQRHTENPHSLRILDFGCGKGAVAIHLSQAFGCSVEGIDALPAFIDDARRHAERCGVSALCQFTVGDLRQFIAGKRDYDAAIWGAVGPVLGSERDTLEGIQPCVRLGGLLFLDTACRPDDQPAYPPYLSNSELRSAFVETGWRVVEESPGGGACAERNRTMTLQIRQRGAELQLRHPHLSQLIEDYVCGQERECRVLEENLICSTWVLCRVR